MGSCLKLGRGEVNTKCESDIIFDEIMKVRKELSDFPLDSPCADYIIEEIDVQGNSIGIWHIRREVIVALIRRFIKKQGNYSMCKEYVENTEEYKNAIARPEEDSEYMLRNYIGCYQNTLQSCINFLTEVLCDMVMKKKKRIKLTWS